MTRAYAREILRFVQDDTKTQTSGVILSEVCAAKNLDGRSGDRRQSHPSDHYKFICTIVAPAPP